MPGRDPSGPPGCMTIHQLLSDQPPDLAPAHPPEGAGQTSREWYRPLPPYKEVEWSMRNNTNYMETGVLSSLQLTSMFPAMVLENFWIKTKNSIEEGKTKAPFAFQVAQPFPVLTPPARYW